MENTKYYCIAHTKYGDNWEETEYFFFLTEKETNEYADRLRAVYRNKNRLTIMKLSFEKMKELITVDKFEELFDITINEPKDQ